ncbi:linear amide C-N hydrolase [Vibrio ruber]|uniref:linear amide C-N hydrolase n=1 Tax=Vibrio ruber TaxID=184755 RepID=UPI002892B205|nr:linear amide C-N hydrolase [Vibrio ruber]WNJ95630.1 linear amide C-N hydrolase [Vibrio ruber]
MRFRLVFPLTSLALALTPPADACTRILYHNAVSNDTHETVQNKAGFFTACSMDWYIDTQTDLWIFPKGMQRTGGDIPGAIKWKSKYGSVVASAFHGATADGINEKGLVANFLYLNEANYGTREVQQPELAVTAWAQYVLDNYETVNQAVEDLRKQPFHIADAMLPEDHKATGHLSISDPSGDSAIFEYIQGKLHIHHGSEYTVMTNSPTFDQQLAINRYWEQGDGWKMLPGTSRSADRFARADFYLKNAQAASDPDDASAAATTLSILRNTSAPLNIKNPDPNKPNEASTIWRTVADQKNLRYYFDSALSPNVFWIDLNKVNLSDTGVVKKLNLQPEKIEVDGHEQERRKVYAGEVSDKFQPAEPFAWIVGETKS